MTCNTVIKKNLFFFLLVSARNVGAPIYNKLISVRVFRLIKTQMLLRCILYARITNKVIFQNLVVIVNRFVNVLMFVIIIYISYLVIVYHVVIQYSLINNDFTGVGMYRATVRLKTARE